MKEGMKEGMKEDIINLKRKVNTIEDKINNIGNLIIDYKKKAGIAYNKDEVLKMNDDFEINFGKLEEIDLNSIKSPDKHTKEKEVFKLNIRDEDIRKNMIVELVMSGYKISIKGNSIIIENGERYY